MRGSSLLVDDVVIGDAGASARIARKFLEFEEDVWIAIGDLGDGKTVGPVTVRKRGVSVDEDRFPDIPLLLDGVTIGIRTSLRVPGNTVYILGLPENFVSQEFSMTLDGDALYWSLEVSARQRLVLAAYVENGGMLAVQGTAKENIEAYLDAVQSPLTMPRPRKSLSDKVRFIATYIVTHPAEAIEAAEAIRHVV